MKPNIRTTACLLLASAALSHSVHSAVLYTEPFLNLSNPGTNNTTSTVGWSSFLGATATATADPGNPPRWAISNAPGPDATNGYLFKDTGASSGIGVAYENTAFSLLPANITDFTYLAGNNLNTPVTRFVVQQDGNWFVSSTAFTTAVTPYATFASTPELKTLPFNTASTSWNALTVNPGVELSIGSATALSGILPITRIGIYADGSGVIRIDDVTINGVPEPSALLLGAFGLLPLLRRKR